MSAESMSEQTFSDHFHNILNEFSWLRRAHDDLERENEDLRAENAELRAGQGRWPEKADDFPCCSSQPTGYADDDHQDGHVKPVDTTPTTCKEKGENFTRPLAVHALNVAPVGSWVSRGMGSNGRRKRDDGLWEKAWLFEGQYPETSEELIASGWADATLRLPEGDS